MRRRAAHSTGAPAGWLRILAHPGARRAVLVALVLAAVALRAYRLGAQSLWSDEDITLDRALTPLGQLLSGLPVEQAPLYFAVVRLWGLVAGTSDWSLRWPSLAFGVLAVPLAAYLGTRLAGRRTGGILALLAAVNPFLVWYGQEARMYSLVGALCLASLAAAMRARSGGGARWWAAAGTGAALAVYTHYWAALLLAVMAAWAAVDVLVLAGSARRDVLRGWSVAAVAAGLLFLPWAPRALQVTAFPGWRQPLPLSRVPWIVLSAWSAGSTSSPFAVRSVTWLYLLLAAVGLAGVASRARRRAGQPDALRILTYVLAPVVAVACLVAVKPDFHPRYFMAAVPAYLLLVAAGAGALPRGADVAAVGALALAAVPSLHGLYTDPAYQKQDYRAVIGTVEAAASNGSVLLLDGPPFGMLERYRADDSPVTILNLRSSALRDLDQATLDEEIDRRVADIHDVWLAEDGSKAGSGLAWLVRRAFPVDRRGIQDVTLGRYWVGSESGSCAARQADPVVRPQPASLEIGLARGSDAGAVPLCLLWHVGPDVHVLARKAYRVSLRLLGPDGRVMASTDQDPVLGTRPTTSWQPGDTVLDRHALLLPIDLRPIDWRVEVVLYDPDTLLPIGRWTWDPSS